jgi:glycosyltransferase involved in cell wall biosynthesis
LFDPEVGIMKIAYFHYLYGQDTALNHVRQFAEAVRGLGHTISVHAMNLAPSDNGRIRNRIRRSLKKSLSRYLHEIKELWWNPRYIVRELDVVRQEKPDVILSRTGLLTASCLAVAKWSGKPLVLEVNSPACESAMYLDQYLHIPWVGEWLEGLTVRRAAEVIVVSDALGQYLKSRHNIGSNKITVNHNGADCEKFHPGLNGSRMRGQLGLDDKKVVGFVGSLHRWRGPDFFIAVMQRVGKISGVTFLLVGDGPEWKKFQQKLLMVELKDNVVFVGRVPHESIPEYLAAMDVAFVPESSFYMSPLKLIEFMAAGVPTVSPRYKAIEELVSDGQNGFLFSPQDVDGAVHCITSALAEDNKRQKIGIAAACKVRRNLTWRHNAERVISACVRVLESSKQAG